MQIMNLTTNCWRLQVPEVGVHHMVPDVGVQDYMYMHAFMLTGYLGFFFFKLPDIHVQYKHT